MKGLIHIILLRIGFVGLALYGAISTLLYIDRGNELERWKFYDQTHRNLLLNNVEEINKLNAEIERLKKDRNLARLALGEALKEKDSCPVMQTIPLPCVNIYCTEKEIEVTANDDYYGCDHTDKVTWTVTEKTQGKKNRVRGVAGMGPNGVSLNQNASGLTAEENQTLIGGIGYDRMVTDKISVGVQFQSNRSYLLGIGFDF